MKVLLDYDPATNWVSADGYQIYCVGLGGEDERRIKLCEYKENSDSIAIVPDRVVQLRESGLAAEELIRLREAGVI